MHVVLVKSLTPAAAIQALGQRCIGKIKRRKKKVIILFLLKPSLFISEHCYIKILHIYKVKKAVKTFTRIVESVTSELHLVTGASENCNNTMQILECLKLLFYSCILKGKKPESGKLRKNLFFNI